MESPFLTKYGDIRLWDTVSLQSKNRICFLNGCSWRPKTYELMRYSKSKNISYTKQNILPCLYINICFQMFRTQCFCKYLGVYVLQKNGVIWHQKVILRILVGTTLSYAYGVSAILCKEQIHHQWTPHYLSVNAINIAAEAFADLTTTRESERWTE